MSKVRDEVIALARSFNFEEGHSMQDAFLALRLFEETRPLHGLGEEHARLLEYAAILHDIGYLYDYENHHKHAFRMIMESDIKGLSDGEKLVVANVARYHRSTLPKLKHKGFAALSEEERHVVEVLGSILRLADGLDRTHTDAVHDLRCEIDRNTVRVILEPPTGNSTERWAGRKKSRFFQKVFNVQVEII